MESRTLTVCLAISLFMCVGFSGWHFGYSEGYADARRIFRLIGTPPSQATPSFLKQSISSPDKSDSLKPEIEACREAVEWLQALQQISASEGEGAGEQYCEAFKKRKEELVQLGCLNQGSLVFGEGC